MPLQAGLPAGALLPWVLQGEQPTGEGLEIGAGSGAMAAQLLAAFPKLRMVATDYDAGMVATARKTLAPFGDRVTAQRADAADLPFDELTRLHATNIRAKRDVGGLVLRFAASEAA